MSRKAKQFKKSTIPKKGNELTKNIPYIKLLYASLTLNILLLVFMFLFQDRIPPEVPLFYGYPDGEDQLAQKSSLIVPSLVSIVSIIINSVIAYFSKDEFVKKILIITGFAITFLSILTTLKIILLVGNF